MPNPKKTFFYIALLTVLALFFALPRQIKIDTKILNIPLKFDRQLPGLNFKFGESQFQRSLNLKKGLDLQGGIQVVLSANMEGIESENRLTALESVRSVISRRVDLYGVAEANVKTAQNEDDYRLIVELPGVDNPQEALDLIGQTASLDFALPIFLPDPASPSAEPVFSGLTPTDLTGADLRLAQMTYETQDRKPGVSIEFKDSGREKFAKLTRENLQKPIAILLDGQVLTAPVVQTEIADGKAIITGSFTPKEAKNMAIQLNAGALPVPISVLSQKNIPPILGQESINKSITAGLVGLAAVAIFMILIYRGLGLIATLGLAIYAILTLAVYKLIPITLTLPGIAGFILSVGMAVDSNILIFERFKEEKHDGRPTPIALELAFGRAWDSIKDANLATIITALILFNPLNWTFLNTSGSVRGFALTLMLGILISLFTGIVVTRTLLRLLIKK